MPAVWHMCVHVGMHVFMREECGVKDISDGMMTNKEHTKKQIVIGEKCCKWNWTKKITKFLKV